MRKIVNKIISEIRLRVKGRPLFKRDWIEFKRQAAAESDGGAAFPVTKFRRFYGDRFSAAGALGGYFWQDFITAKKIFKANPERHIDIGSRIDGFVTHVASFRKIEILDIRPLGNLDENMIFRQVDLMDMPEDLENCCDSVSTLHAVEHFGLGRYGDPVDYNGHIKAIRNITRILKPGGTLYFGGPIGRQKIEFHAHRIFSPAYLWSLFKRNYEFVSFSHYEHVTGSFSENTVIPGSPAEPDFTGFEFEVPGVAVFELRKKQEPTK